MNESYGIMKRIGASNSAIVDDYIKQAEADLANRITEIDVSHRDNLKEIQHREAQLYEEEKEKREEIDNLKRELLELE